MAFFCLKLKISQMNSDQDGLILKKPQFTSKKGQISSKTMMQRYEQKFELFSVGNLNLWSFFNGIFSFLGILSSFQSSSGYW